MVRKFFIILFVIMFSAFYAMARTTVSSPYLPVLFVVYDTGETQALKHVMKVFDDKKITYGIIALGVAAKLLKNNNHVIDIRKQCHFKTHIDPKNWEWALRIPEYDINSLSLCLKPSVIVTGMSSTAQAQIVQRFSKQGTKVIGYYDGLNEPRPNPALLTIIQNTDVIIVPESHTADYFKKKKVAARIEILGQPAAESWRTKVPNFDKKKVCQDIGLDEIHKPVILYLGGYGIDYERSFELFVKSLPQLQNKEILIAIHPKADGATEQAILTMHKTTNYTIVPKNVAAIEAAAIADIIVTQRSPKAPLAFFANLPVIYLDAKPESFTNIIIDNKAAPQVNTVADFLKLIAVTTKPQYTDQQLTDMLGVPFDAAKNIAVLIQSYLTAPIFL